MTMDLRHAVDTLQKFKNVLGSVEALEKALSVAASLEQHVEAKTAQRDRLVEDLNALEVALTEGGEKLRALKQAAADSERELNEFRETTSKRISDEAQQARAKALREITQEASEAAAKRDAVNAEIVVLRSRKRALEESVATLDAKLRELRAAATSV